MVVAHLKRKLQLYQSVNEKWISLPKINGTNTYAKRYLEEPASELRRAGKHHESMDAEFEKKKKKKLEVR